MAFNEQQQSYFFGRLVAGELRNEIYEYLAPPTQPKALRHLPMLNDGILAFSSTCEKARNEFRKLVLRELELRWDEMGHFLDICKSQPSIQCFRSRNTESHNQSQ
jgi:monomeric isocitrate dehydrogenase